MTNLRKLKREGLNLSEKKSELTKGKPVIIAHTHNTLEYSSVMELNTEKVTNIGVGILFHGFN